MNARFRRFAAAFALSFATSAQAQHIEVSNAGLEISEARYFLNADFRLFLSGPLLEALNNGVSLGFLVEFQLAHRSEERRVGKADRTCFFPTARRRCARSRPM